MLLDNREKRIYVFAELSCPRGILQANAGHLPHVILSSAFWTYFQIYGKKVHQLLFQSPLSCSHSLQNTEFTLQYASYTTTEMFNNEQAYFCLQLFSLKPPPKLSEQPESSNSWKVLHTALCTEVHY